MEGPSARSWAAFHFCSCPGSGSTAPAPVFDPRVEGVWYLGLALGLGVRVRGPRYLGLDSRISRVCSCPGSGSTARAPVWFGVKPVTPVKSVTPTGLRQSGPHMKPVRPSARSWADLHACSCPGLGSTAPAPEAFGAKPATPVKSVRLTELSLSRPQRPLGTRGSRVEGPHTRGTSLGGVPREQKMLKGHLPTVKYHQVYKYTKIRSVRPTAFSQSGPHIKPVSWGLGLGFRGKG